MKRFFILALNAAALFAWEGRTAAQEYKLWYDAPAAVWTEALPLGNSALGAMVYGNPAAEQIQLNEETLWAGRPNDNANPDALEWIPKIRQLVFEGKYLEAQTLCTQHVKAATNSGMPFQTFGDLRINFAGHSRYDNYYRELSLDSARTVVRYRVGGRQLQTGDIRIADRPRNRDPHYGRQTRVGDLYGYAHIAPSGCDDNE